jgi:hypothetical protein
MAMAPPESPANPYLGLNDRRRACRRAIGHKSARVDGAFASQQIK